MQWFITASSKCGLDGIESKWIAEFEAGKIRDGKISGFLELAPENGDAEGVGRFPLLAGSAAKG